MENEFRPSDIYTVKYLKGFRVVVVLSALTLHGPFSGLNFKIRFKIVSQNVGITLE